MKKLPFILFVTSFFLALSSTHVIAQDAKQQKENKKQQTIKELINALHYTFVPQTVLPTRGPAKQLTSEYELKIKNDTLESYLPYFGRAYSSSIGSTESPLDFKTTDFKYSVTDRKKGGWDIVITPKNGDARQLQLSVSQDGYASLEVISTNRDPISFNGYIIAQ
jgi:Domain of unknown function (DUF4251)